MPKRQKAKPVSAKPTTPIVSVAKQRRIATQAAAEQRNKEVGATRWETTKFLRTVERRKQGRHDLWAMNKAQKDSQPNAANTLTERKRGGQIKSKAS